jgi:hypothetical protein
MPTPPTPVNQNAVPAGAQGTTAAVTPRNLSNEAQHVIDSLEAHLGAVTKAAAGNPALEAGVAKFADDALGLLESWGAHLRVQLQTAEAKSPATASAVGSLDTAAGVSAAPPSAA